MRGNQLSQNLFKNNFCFFQNIVIPKPDYPIPFRFKKCSSICIVCYLLDMLTTIEFDN